MIKTQFQELPPLNIWGIHYNFKNIQSFLQTGFLSALTANILVPVIIAFILFPYFSLSLLSTWLGIHFIVFFLRIFLRENILRDLKKQRISIAEIKILLLLTVSTTFLFAYIIMQGAFAHIPRDTMFLLTAVILTLSAGSLSTLMSVFHFFVLFLLVNMLSIIAALLYYGGTIFYIYALVLTIFIIIFIQSGYKQYILLNNLSSLKESFESIYNRSFDGMIIIKNHTIADCNPALYHMFGYDSKEEYMHAPLSQLMPKYQEDGSLSVKKMLLRRKEALKNGHSSFEWLYKKKNGDLFWTEIVFTKIYANDEVMLHGIYRDITNKKELEVQKLEFQNKLKQQVQEEIEKNRLKDQQILEQSRLAQMGEMISMIAHQWRQPLNAISSASINIILKAQVGKLDKENAIEIAEKISEYTQHLSNTIDDFRDFFKSNKVQKEISYNEVLESVLNIVEVSLKNKNITLVKNLDSTMVFHTYANEIKQVFLNLIKNAEDALMESDQEKKIITFESYENTFCIKDNAGGVPQEIIEKVFDPYFSTKSKNGTGLGLYMSKTIIEEHCHGTLSVHNDQEGAVFCIKLPKESSISQ